MSDDWEYRSIDKGRGFAVAIGIIGFLSIPLVMMKYVFVPTDDVWIVPGIFLFGGLWLWVWTRIWDALEAKKKDQNATRP